MRDTLREHMSKIAKLKTPSQQAARSRNVKHMLRCRELVKSGLDKPSAILQARREAQEASQS